ncbi:MAG TPA: PIN domain-containing protein, partial [Candidatus Hodarchaeales archaeon]|nr:PIN domain-containing protein [Candidatus Hodarchaeales archaeon]
TLQEVKNTCLVVIDTNALLVPYLIGPNGFAQIRKTYNALAEQKRIVIPGQVAREFAKNRTNKIAELYQQINRRKASLPKGQYPLLEGIPEYLEAVQLESKIDKLLAEYRAALDKVLETIQSWEWNDPVSMMYQEIFGTDSISDPSFDKSQVADEFRSRYQNKIPPGYKDSGKEDEGIGDFLIWKTILELGKTRQKAVILVSGEQKSDWRIKSEGKSLYPRYELVDEFKRCSGGQSFHLLQFSDFLNLYGASDTTVQEVREKELEISTSISATRIPSALVQILMVCDEVLRKNREYTEAVKAVADELEIREQSVADKCTRKIGVNTQTFRELLQNKDELVRHLVDWFPEYEEIVRSKLR